MNCSLLKFNLCVMWSTLCSRLFKWLNPLKITDILQEMSSLMCLDVLGWLLITLALFLLHFVSLWLWSWLLWWCQLFFLEEYLAITILLALSGTYLCIWNADRPLRKFLTVWHTHWPSCLQIVDCLWYRPISVALGFEGSVRSGLPWQYVAVLVPFDPELWGHWEPSVGTPVDGSVEPGALPWELVGKREHSGLF